MTREAVLILIGSCVGLLAPRSTCAQSSVFLRVAPEAGRISVEHTKKVTIGGGSSSSASTSSGLVLAGNLTAGVQHELAGSWLLGAEIEGIAHAQRLLEGTIHPTSSGNDHDVWRGSWDYSDRYGMGVGLLAGRLLGHGGSKGYVFGGLRRMWTEVATGGVNPANGEAGEDRDTHERRPWTAGAGVSLDWKRPIDIRVRYTRSYLDWIISQGSLRLDYRYNTSKLSISVGVGIQR